MAENDPKEQEGAPQEESAPDASEPQPASSEESSAEASAPEAGASETGEAQPEAEEEQPEEPSADAAPGETAEGAGDQSSALAEEALKAAQQAISDMASEAGAAASSEGPDAGDGSADASRFEPPAMQAAVVSGDVEGIELLSDVNLHVKIELGRTRMFVEDVLRLRDGAVVELDKLAGDPVDIYVNDRPVARGEVLILNDAFCVRVNEILAGAKSE